MFPAVDFSSNKLTPGFVLFRFRTAVSEELTPSLEGQTLNWVLGIGRGFQPSDEIT